jgi:hypothetical protein
MVDSSQLHRLNFKMNKLFSMNFVDFRTSLRENDSFSILDDSFIRLSGESFRIEKKVPPNDGKKN